MRTRGREGWPALSQVRQRTHRIRPRHREQYLALVAVRDEVSRSRPLLRPRRAKRATGTFRPTRALAGEVPIAPIGSHQGQSRLTSPHHGCVLARYGFVRTNRRPSGLPVRIILPSLTLGGGRAARLTRSRPEDEGPIRLLRIGPENRLRRAVLPPAAVVVHGPLGDAGELPRQREREAHAREVEAHHAPRAADGPPEGRTVYPAHAASA